MVKPTFFEVKYAINPHMLDENGKLNSIDYNKAQNQWSDLKYMFESINLKVEVIEGGEGLPDMVFSANHALPLIGKKEVVFGKMYNLDRAREIDLFKKWYTSKGYKIHELDLSEKESFEGMGDAIWSGTPKVLLGGYGLRTTIEVYDKLESLLNIKVIRLKLVSDKFYHLDTCLCVLDKETVSIVKMAFDEESLNFIKKQYKNIIEINEPEAINNFAANSFCPDKKNVIVQKGAAQYCRDLKKIGFIPIEVDTSEYMKAGGSVFCMKMVVES